MNSGFELDDPITRYRDLPVQKMLRCPDVGPGMQGDLPRGIAPARQREIRNKLIREMHIH